MTKRFILTFICLMMGLPFLQDSFAFAQDVCSEVNTGQQVDRCSEIAKNAADSQLNTSYHQLMARLEVQYQADPEAGAAYALKVKETQRIWIKLRDSNCPLEAFEIESGTSAHITTVNNCIARMSLERAKFLDNIAPDIAAGSAVGHGSDGEHLDIRGEERRTADADQNVERRPRNHLGNSQCPGDNFAEFVKSFSTQPETQKAFVASPVQQLQVVADGLQPKVVERDIKALDPTALSVLAPENAARSNLTIQVDLPNKVIVRDQLGGFLKVFVFKHDDCWVLTRAEDWSLEKVMDAVDKTEKLSAGDRALKKGAMFDRLASVFPSESGVYLYTAALDSYLAGAQQGSAQAAFAAAGISLSGQAPRLENAKILDLFVMASKSIPEAGLALADFYCDEGEYGETRACVNPEKSFSTLVKSASSGAASALLQLGGAYETGAIVPGDLPRAMACYKDAEKRGQEAATSAVERLHIKGIAADNKIRCL